MADGQDSNSADALIRYPEAARMLGLKEGTLRARVSRHQIPHVRLSRRLVRFDRAELERYIEQHRVAARDCVRVREDLGRPRAA